MHLLCMFLCFYNADCLKWKPIINVPLGGLLLQQACVHFHFSYFTIQVCRFWDRYKCIGRDEMWAFSSTEEPV